MRFRGRDGAVDTVRKDSRRASLRSSSPCLRRVVSSSASSRVRVTAARRRERSAASRRHCSTSPADGADAGDGDERGVECRSQAGLRRLRAQRIWSGLPSPRRGGARGAARRKGRRASAGCVFPVGSGGGRRGAAASPREWPAAGGTRSSPASDWSFAPRCRCSCSTLSGAALLALLGWGGESS
ncbi:unnamed protein product [Urochloa humidicola]